jgi:hypothetical protein
MKKFFIFYLFVFVAVMAFYSFSGNDVRYPSGAPAGYTGSPSDGKDCTHCHNGTASDVDGWITSNAPETGYVPGETYDITLTVASGGKKGFEISPQSFSGNLQGELHAVAGTKLVGSGKYITHSNKVSSNPAIWTFQWTAPAEGTGNVVLYGAVAINESQTKLTTLLIPEDITATISEIEEPRIKVFPNPVKNNLFINYSLPEPENVKVKLYGINGALIDILFSGSQAQGTHSLDYLVDGSLESGVYLISLEYNSEKIIKRILVQ